MHSFRDRFFRFMEGRYGLRGLQDGLQIVLYAAYFVLVLINFFARSRIVNGLELLLIAYMLFRILSKNIPARENEGRQVSEFLYKMRDAFRFRQANAREKERQKAIQKERKKDKEHIYRECPSCVAQERQAWRTVPALRQQIHRQMQPIKPIKRTPALEKHRGFIMPCF